MAVTLSKQVYVWYERAQIDYTQQYMALYASFNAWYRQTVRAHSDREALNQLREGNVVWREYCDGFRLYELRMPMRHLVELTQREPLSHATPHWNGEVNDIYDWPSLIEYWYRVRCLVMHGVEIRPVYVHLAYQTLNHFMGEVVQSALD